MPPLFSLTDPPLTALSSTNEVGEQSILLVDDDVAMRSTAAMMLEGEGFKVFTASNGLEALCELERNPQIAAVLLDLLMPVMDGKETFRQIRNFWESIPVIIVSGFDLSEMAHDLSGLPDGFVKKPFTFAHLTGALAGVLS